MMIRSCSSIFGRRCCCGDGQRPLSSLLFLLVFLVAVEKILVIDANSSSDTVNHPRRVLRETVKTKPASRKRNGDNGKNDNGNNGGESCLSQSKHPDRMFEFPGWNQPLPSAWYSGYLEYEFQGQRVHTHYVLVQAEEEELPLIYWSNGGPGASSLFGLLTELGPLMLSDASLQTQSYRDTGIPTPIYNPYTWTRLGSILMIDQPAPVGFSYCNDNDGIQNKSSHSCGGIAWTDELASLNAFTALQTFYSTKFPCLSDKPLYLTGESYGGIYIPTLARRIVQAQRKEQQVNNRNDKNDNSIASSLKLMGFAVGDGCLGTHTNMCGSLGGNGFVDFWHIWFMVRT